MLLVSILTVSAIGFWNGLCGMFFLYELVYAKYSKVLMWFTYNIFVGMLTRRAREGVDALEKNKIILLTGIDGIGKTFTAKEIIKLYCGRHHDFNESDQSNLYRLQVKPSINYFLSDRIVTCSCKSPVLLNSSFKSIR
jgi:hypothetical protein